MSDKAHQHLIAIDLDERSILWRNADVEQERRVAIFDLLEHNFFAPKGHVGPFRMVMSVADGRLNFDIRNQADAPLIQIILALSPFRRIIRDYFAICDSYYTAIRDAAPSHIETIDMARRGIHNDGAELLVERLQGKIEIDFDTGRRLFTLICVLHIRGMP